MSYEGNSFKDKKGSRKVLKINFPNRVTESNEMEEISLGEFMSFNYSLNNKEKQLVIPKEGKLRDRLCIFLYADPSLKHIKAVELKTYMMNLKDPSGKVISLSEGLSFIKNYIKNMFDEKQDLEYSINKDITTIGEDILVIKKKAQNPVSSTYTVFDKTFFAGVNNKQLHFESFIRTFEISKIRDLEKVVITDEIFKKMQSNVKLSKRNGI
jgi:hypothetical protein